MDFNITGPFHTVDADAGIQKVGSSIGVVHANTHHLHFPAIGRKQGTQGKESVLPHIM